MKNKHKKLYIDILNAYKQLSTCDRIAVVALLVKDGRALSVGYNGTPPGQMHCNEIFSHVFDENGKHYFIKGEEVSEKTYMEKHHEFSESNEIHAETNCIAFALKNHIDISDCDLILSLSPCIKCAKMILACGIKNVYYVEHYDRSTEGLDFLIKNKVNCFNLKEI